MFPLDVNPLWDFSQAANQYLGVAVTFFVMYRLTPMVLDRARWHDPRALHYMLWFIYIALAGIVTSLLAVYYRSNEADPSWPSGLRALLSISAIVLCIWWPHPLRFRAPDRGSTG